MACGAALPQGWPVIPGVGRVCMNCAKVRDYWSANEAVAGKGNSSFSVEFETGSNDVGQYVLLTRGYMPTHDSSIGGIEWKSPIYKSRRPFRWDCEHVLGRLAHLVDERCGTHLHVGASHGLRCDLRYSTKHIFGPLLNYLRRHEDRTSAFWGRCFNPYCTPDFHSGHYGWVNPDTRYDTFEFRLLKFVTWEQYYAAASFCLALMERLEAWHRAGVNLRVMGSRTRDLYRWWENRYFLGKLPHQAARAA